MIKLTDILNEITVHKPGIRFHFRIVDNGSGIEYVDDITKKFYWAPYDDSDEFIFFNMGIEGDYDDMMDGDPNNPQPFVDYLKELDSEFDIEQFQSFINNLVKFKIPIKELHMIGESLFIYINIALPTESIKPYIKQ